MKKTLTMLALAGSLALPAVASAGDAKLAGLGQTSVRQTLRYANCSTHLCRVKAATGFINADNAMLTYMNGRIKRGDVEYGTPCYKAALRWSNLPARSLPWKVGFKWLAGSVSDTRLASAQIAWLQQAVKVAAAC